MRLTFSASVDGQGHPWLRVTPETAFEQDFLREHFFRQRPGQKPVMLEAIAESDHSQDAGRRGQSVRFTVIKAEDSDEDLEASWSPS